MSDSNWYERTAAFNKQGDPYAPGETSPRDKQAATIFRIRKRTTLGDVFVAFLQELSEKVQDDLGVDASAIDIEIRGDDDLGFRLTKREEISENIIWYVDVSMQLAPDYLRLNVKGSKQETDFSSTIRMFLTDRISKISRRIAGKVPAL